MRPAGIVTVLVMLALTSISCQKADQTGTDSSAGMGSMSGSMMGSVDKAADPATPAASTTESTVNWKEFVHPGGAFRVSVPFEMKRNTAKEEPGEEKWFGESPAFGVGIYYTTFPAQLTANKTHRKILEITLKTLSGGRAVNSQQFVTSNGIEYLEYRIQAAQGTKTSRIAFQQKTNAVMEFGVVSPGTGSTDIENRFFDSIQLARD